MSIVLKNHTFSCRLLSLRYISLFFRLVIFLLFQPNPYTRMCVSTLGASSLSGKNAIAALKPTLMSKLCKYKQHTDTYVFSFIGLYWICRTFFGIFRHMHYGYMYSWVSWCHGCEACRLLFEIGFYIRLSYSTQEGTIARPIEITLPVCYRIHIPI